MKNKNTQTTNTPPAQALFSIYTVTGRSLTNHIRWELPLEKGKGKCNTVLLEGIVSPRDCASSGRQIEF
jgi:hypothetical protein